MPLYKEFVDDLSSSVANNQEFLFWPQSQVNLEKKFIVLPMESVGYFQVYYWTIKTENDAKGLKQVKRARLSDFLG